MTVHQDYEIKININAFENIELTSTDMMVTQSGVPYPIVVPSFPRLTNDDKLKSPAFWYGVAFNSLYITHSQVSKTLLKMLLKSHYLIV